VERRVSEGSRLPPLVSNLPISSGRTPSRSAMASSVFAWRSSGDTIPNCLVVIRSIFSTCNALCQGGLLTLLDVPPSVCYPSGRRWQGRGPKPGGQRNLDLRIGRGSASRHDDCQHQERRRARKNGWIFP